MSDILKRVLQPETISLQLHSKNKTDLIKELVDLLDKAGLLQNREQVETDLFEREEQLSTGLSDGIAMPHAKTDGVTKLTVAIGIKPQGIDFEALDGNPSTLFIMAVIPKNSSGEHLQLMSAISAKLLDETVRKALLNASSPQAAIDSLLSN